MLCSYRFDFERDAELSEGLRPAPQLHSQRIMKTKISAALAALGLGLAAALLPFAAQAADAAQAPQQSAAPERVPLTDADAVHVTDNPVLALKIEKFRSAIRTGNIASIEDFLDEGLTPNVMMGNGDTAFTYAMRADQPRVAKLLLDSGKLNVNKPNRFGETPLMMAVFKGDKTIFEALLERGANPNGSKNWTALHYAAASGMNDFVKKLLELGADPNAQTKAGVTPLIMAARKPSRETVLTLLRAGAYRDYCTDRGLSPADFARKAGDDELADYLAVETCAVKGPKNRADFGLPPLENPKNSPIH